MSADLGMRIAIGQFNELTEEKLQLRAADRRRRACR